MQVLSQTRCVSAWGIAPVNGRKKNTQEGRPLITIITATYNAAKHLPYTIKSIREQTYKNIEWIVVDGASQDSTVELLKQNEDIVDYWVSEPDRGIADAWNKGLALASGCGVLILNAGDTYTPNAIALFSANFQPNKITCASANLVSIEGEILGIFKPRPWKLWHGMHVPHNWCLVPIAFYQDLGGYPERKYSMDFAWFHRYYRIYGCGGFIALDEILGNYSLGGISDIHSSAGFKNNAQIIISAGGSRLIAWPVCIAYMLKHYFFHYWNKT